MQIVDLNNFDLIAIDGVDAKKYLQGQITCDVDELTPTHSIEGAICNIKGRVIANFRLVEFQHSCYLQLAVGMADIVKPVLDKYMVFSQAESRIAVDQVTRIGVLGDLDSTHLSTFGPLPVEDGNVVINGNTILIKIPGLTPRYELWQFDAGATDQVELLDKLHEESETIPVERWELEDIRAGIAHIIPPLFEQHLPEALNYDINGVINFKKGCYTGQEIVARMFYRGSAKKRLFCVSCAAAAEQPETIGALLKDTEDIMEGEIVNSARDEDGDLFVLAILPSAAGDPGTEFYLNGARETTARVSSLPYVTD